MSEKWRQYEICIVINDKSQGSRPIAKHLRNDDLLTTHFILSLNFLVKEFLNW